MLLRTVSRDWIACPACGERHGECANWVKSMPHREICSCGAEMLCWFETEITYHAEVLGEQERKKREKKKGKAGKEARKKRKKR
ncbi:MAG TPA: hypothetical protein VGG95_04430 [Edaphobacter sp.]